MRTWMRRGIPAALLAGGVLAMSAGNAAAAPAPIGDPTGVADTALKLADIVGHKGLPPLPFASQLELPAMPIGQSQRSLDPQDLAGGGLSLSNVQLNGQDLPKPQLPGLPALPGLGGGERSLDPSHIAISDLPQLQQLPKLPSVASGLPVSVLPEMSTSRSLPNLTYSGVVPTGGLHSLTKVPDLNSVSELTDLSNPTQLPDVPQLPLDDDQQRSLPGLDLLGKLPGGDLLGTLPGLGGQQRALPAVPGLEIVHGLIANTPLAALLASVPLGSVAGRDLPGIPAIPALPLHLPGVPAGRDLPGLNLLGSLPGLGALPGVPAGRELPGLNLLGNLPGLGALGRPADAETTSPDGRSLPGIPALPKLPLLNGLPLGAPADADGTDADATPDTAARSLPGVPALPKLPGLDGLPLGAAPAGAAGTDARSLPGLGSLPLAGLLGGGVPGMTDTDADASDTDADAADAVGDDNDARNLPVVDSLLPKLPLAVPAVPGASLSGFHGIPALGPSFTTMPANDSARSVVPGVPSTSDLLGGLLGHAPRLPVSGI